MRIHDDFFDPNASDVEWIRETASRGWIAFAADEAIVRRELERRAVVGSGARILVPGLRKRPARDRAELLVAALPAILRFLDQNPPPSVATVRPGRKSTHRLQVERTFPFLK